MVVQYYVFFFYFVIEMMYGKRLLYGTTGVDPYQVFKMCMLGDFGYITRQRLGFGAGSVASRGGRNPSSDRRYPCQWLQRESYAAADLKEFLVDRGLGWLLGTWVRDWTKRVARFGIMAICHLLLPTTSSIYFFSSKSLPSNILILFRKCSVERVLSVPLQIYMAGGGGKEGSSRNLDQTPTWAVSGVCAVIILISIALEKMLHKVGTWLTERHKKALYEALEKVKAELMILGFISLILVFSQYYIADICIPINVADTMLPCPTGYQNENKEGNHHRLLSYERRVLAAKKEPSCKEGHVSLISVDGLHQIHILIFFLAVFHVIYSAITMALGRLKIRGWKQWEQETLSHDYKFSNDPARFRLSHETSFVKAHSSFWTRIPIFFYIGCFFRQFFRSVGKFDYLTLRNGFITVHLAPGSKFNFQKYIKRSLEDDFKIVVGVSPVLWGIICVILAPKCWRALFWASLIPLIIILAVGTKLQAILTRMALDITDRHAVVQGMPLVQGSDKYFWFGRPQLVLHLIHFALFQNAFQITYFFWIWYEYGINSCFHDNIKLLFVKIALGVFVLCLCSYITLPLYALIAQMGSNMKKSIFDEQTSKALKKWHMAVKKKHRGREGRSPTRTLGDVSPISSTGYPFRPTGATLQRFKTTGHSTRSYGREENDGSDIEEPLSHMTATSSLIIRNNRDDIERSEQDTKTEDDFSFVKPSPQK